MNKALEKTTKKVMSDYNIDLIEIKSRRRTGYEPRWIIWHLNRKFTYQSLLDIGKKFNRDHTSIMRGLSELQSRYPEKIKLYEKYYNAQEEKEKEFD